METGDGTKFDEESGIDGSKSPTVNENVKSDVSDRDIIIFLFSIIYCLIFLGFSFGALNDSVTAPNKPSYSWIFFVFSCFFALVSIVLYARIANPKIRSRLSYTIIICIILSTLLSYGFILDTLDKGFNNIISDASHLFEALVLILTFIVSLGAVFKDYYDKGKTFFFNTIVLPFKDISNILLRALFIGVLIMLASALILIAFFGIFDFFSSIPGWAALIIILLIMIYSKL